VSVIRVTLCASPPWAERDITLLLHHSRWREWVRGWDLGRGIVPIIGLSRGGLARGLV